jgi:hypothetical protein
MATLDRSEIVREHPEFQRQRLLLAARQAEVPRHVAERRIRPGTQVDFGNASKFFPAFRSAPPAPAGHRAPARVLPRSPASATRTAQQKTFRRKLARRRRGAEKRNPIPG